MVLYFLGSYIMLWIQAMVSGARVGLFNIIFMRLRKVPAKLIVNCKIMAVKAGIDLTTNDLESHFLAGGNVMRVVQALIAADKANIELGFNRASAIDLAGRNVMEAVQMSVNPKVIKTPMVAAVAKDGIQLQATSLVTVRTNIDRLVGGAGEETVLARVGEGIVSTIGSSESYKDVLENPDSISKRVLGKGLDAGTAFEILSIDIADVDVGKNIGAGACHRPGGSGQENRPGQGGRTPGHGVCRRTGDEGAGSGNAGQSGGGRSPGAAGHGRSVSKRGTSGSWIICGSKTSRPTLR